MNKSALRNFAVWARRDLIKRISDRATLLGVYEDKPAKPIQAETQNGFVVNGVTFNYKKEMREAFINKVKELGYKDAIEEIAYTWFNRIVALRFMEVNGYLKNGKNGEQIYIIGSTVAGKTEPDAITYADKLSFVDKFKVYDLQDANNIDGLYRYILTKQCNDLNKVMPQMFVEIDNYIELMLPDHLLDKGAIIDRLLNDINEKDFNITVKDEDGENASQVEIIGWLYQFYISEKKDEVFANKELITKGTLPAVTQLFTPDWIVKYMVENSLGKMWVGGHKTSNIKSDLKYYVEDAEQTDEVKQKLDEINKEYSNKSIKEITFIDPCCGSGHILVYAFDLFYKMYKESGYFASDIPALILQNNLFGIDVDKRAAQLTSFALTMKALSYDKDFLSKQVYPTVIDIKESNNINTNEVKEFIKLAKLNSNDEELVLDLMEKFQDAELYGSLIKDFNYSPESYDGLYQQINNTIHADEFFNIIDRTCVLNIKPILCLLLKQAYILSSKYDIMATNPPYLATLTNDKLSNFAKTFYPDSKSDLFAMFMESPLVKINGFRTMINMHSWMFLQSFEKLRYKQVKCCYQSMIHLGARAFEDIGGEVVQTTSFVILNSDIKNFNSKFYRLVDYKSQQLKEVAFLNKEHEIINQTTNFMLINGCPFSYWLSKNIYSLFQSNQKLIGDKIECATGLSTSDNNRFLRLWFEVNYNKTNMKNDVEHSKWISMSKGGSFRRWYGNKEYVINWENDGFEIKDYARQLYGCSSRTIKNVKSFFKSGLTWSALSSKLSVRTMDNSIFGSGANCAFSENDKFFLALFNTPIISYIVNALNPTLNMNVSEMLKIPYIASNNENINRIVDFNVNVTKLDWDMYETSWDFNRSLLLPNCLVFDLQNHEQECYLKAIFDNFKTYVNSQFDKLKAEEENLNKIFIELYGLDNELSPIVDESEISVTRIYDKKGDIPDEMKGNIYVKTKQDVVKDLISYIVGCAFGRYSPYRDGLQFAGGKFDWDKYFNDIQDKEKALVQNIRKTVNSFMPAYDHCLLISNNEYVENDLVSYIVDFIEKIYTPTCLEENLKFIADALDDSHKYTPRQVIRNYLFNDFFKDHCKKYQNRPIYWLMDSGKNGGFRALIYMHRFDENTLPTVRFNYLHDIQWKYDQEKERLENIIQNSSITSEKTKAKKELDLIDKQIVECQAYDEILNHATNMKIELDLDDGVKTNYNKLQKLDGDKDKNILSTYLKFKD